MARENFRKGNDAEFERIFFIQSFPIGKFMVDMVCVFPQRVKVRSNSRSLFCTQNNESLERIAKVIDLRILTVRT